MKVLLLYPHVETVYGPPAYPPLGLAYISASIKAGNIDHDILDLRIYEDWQEVLDNQLLKNQYNIVGISATSFEYNNALDIAHLIKERFPQIKVILGGIHATIMKEKILIQDKNIDFTIMGEGEYSLKKLILAICRRESFENIEGLCYRKGGNISCNRQKLIDDLDSLPFPNYHNFELNRYAARNTLTIATSRGCPFHCIYCSVGIMMGRRFRARSPENIIKEIEYLKRQYKMKLLHFIDDNFTFDVNRAKKICQLMIEKEIKISWELSNGIIANKLNGPLVKIMKEAGCKLIALGIESVEDDILRNLQKGVTLEIIEKAIALVKKYNIFIKGFFLIGSPGETAEGALKSLEFAERRRLDEARFGMLTPYPGTKLWDYINENRYWVVNDPLDAISRYTHIGKVKALYQTPEFSAKEREEVYDLVWNQWEKYKTKRSFKKRIRHIIERYPILYNILRKVYRIYRRL